MKLDLTLHMMTYTHNDVKHVSPSVIIWNGRDILSTHCLAIDAHDSKSAFDVGLGVFSVADSVVKLLTALGHTVHGDYSFKTVREKIMSDLGI